MTIAANARLQTRILAQMLKLHPEPVKVIAELARGLDSPRSSVSRAMHALDDAGLVKKGTQGWELTHLGLDLARDIKRVEPMVRATQSSLRTLDLKGFSDYANQASALRGFAEMGNTVAAQIQSIERQVSAYEKIQRALGASIYARVSALDGFAQSLVVPSAVENIMSALNNITDSYPDMSAYATSMRVAQESLGSFAISQSQNLAIMTAASSIGSLSTNVFAELGTTNVWLGRIVNNLGAINSLGAFQSSLIARAENLLSPVAELSRVYETYMGDIASRVGEMLSNQPYGFMLASPTKATARYIEVVTDLVLPEDRDEPLRERNDITLAEHRWAKAFFSQFGSHFSRMWDGALASVKSDNPDRVRQAAHSARELVMQLLAFLAPDNMFSPEEIARYGDKNRVTRTMRVKRIMVGRLDSASNLADHLAKTINELYNELLAISHNRSSDERITEEHLEGLLFIIYGTFKFMIGGKE